MNEREVLQRYIARLHDLRDRPPLGPDALEAVAREVGVPASTLRHAESEAENHRVRSQTLLAAGRPEEAVAELEAAAELAPWWPELDAALARACLAVARARPTRARGALDRAETHARRALALRPDDLEIADLLNAIDAVRVQPSTRRASRLARLVAGVGLGVAGAGALLVLGVLSLVGALAGLLLWLDAATPPAPPEPSASYASRNTDIDVPVRVLNADGTPAEHVRITRSYYRQYRSETRYYKLAGYVENRGADDILRYTGVAEILDAQGQILGSTPLNLVTTSDGALPPGALAPIYGIEPVLEDPALVRVRLDPPRLGPGHALESAPITWTVPAPPGADLEVEVGPGAKGWRDARVVVENIGSVDLDKLEVNVRFLDASGELLDEDDVRVIDALDPAFEAGSRWSKSVHAPEGTEQARVEVIQVKGAR